MERHKVTPGSHLQESPSSRSDSEEEKIDQRVIEKYRKDLDESGEEDEDLSDYLSGLESKGPKQEDE